MKDLGALEGIGTLESFGAGDWVIEWGALETHLYRIVSGSLQVVDEAQTVISEHGPGEVVGEMAFVSNAPRRRGVRAAQSARLERIERGELLQALADRPRELARLLAALDRLGEVRRAGMEARDDADYVAQLKVEAKESRAVRHPYLDAMGAGDFPDVRWALADFASQYFGYSSHFPRYLGTLISRLEDPEQRDVLVENLSEESGQYSSEDLELLAAHGVEPGWVEGVPHPELFRRFSRAVGAAEALPDRESDAVVCWRELFLSVLGHAPAAEAVGALGLDTEGIVSEIYKPFEAVAGRLELDPSSMVFFPLHTLVDDHHQEALGDIACSFAATEEGRKGLRRGMRKALSLRSGFWDWLYQRALDPGRADDLL